MMRHARTAIVVLLALVTAACAGRRCPDPRDMSGFLDDYSRLRCGGAHDLPFVYRNPDAQWTAYRKILLEPVTLWRSGRHAFSAIPEEDLLRLVSIFETAIRQRLGEGFALVDEPAAGTLRLRLAITEARASDPQLDVLTATGDAERHTGGVLRPELRRFIDAAAIEGEILDAETNVLLVQGIDHRRRKGARPIRTWEDLDRALEFWADRMCSRLEARTKLR